MKLYKDFETQSLRQKKDFVLKNFGMALENYLGRVNAYTITPNKKYIISASENYLLI
jgi:penicillin-binding protein-related factor A (putative recombinase)